MARVERTSSTQPVAVEQAQLIDPSAFRFSMASAEALEVIGGTLGELASRRIKARDSLAISEMNKSQDLANAKMKQFMVDNPDTEKWGEERQRLNQEHSKLVTGLKVSNEVREKMNIAFQAYDEKSTIDTNILAVTKDIDNDIRATGADLTTAMSNNDGSAEGQLREDEARDAHEAALLRRDTPEVAAVQLAETLKEGKKAFWFEQSKLFPDKIIKQMEKKKKALGKGGMDKDGLGAKDFDDIIASAYQSIALSDRAVDTQNEEDRDLLGQALQDGTIDYTMINNTSLSEKEQEQYRIKMNAESERKAKGLALAIDRGVEAELEGMAYDISSEAVSLSDFKKRLEEAYVNDDIDGALRSTLNSLGERKFATYQSEAMKERETFALGQLVTLPREEHYLEALKRFTPAEKKEAQTLRQLEFDNLDKYKRALRDWLKKPENKDADASKIYREGRALLGHYRFTPEELRKGKRIFKLPVPGGIVDVEFEPPVTQDTVIAPPPPPGNSAERKQFDKVMKTYFKLPAEKQREVWQAFRAGFSWSAIAQDEMFK